MIYLFKYFTKCSLTTDDIIKLVPTGWRRRVDQTTSLVSTRNATDQQFSLSFLNGGGGMALQEFLVHYTERWSVSRACLQLLLLLQVRVAGSDIHPPISLYVCVCMCVSFVCVCVCACVRARACVRVCARVIKESMLCARSAGVWMGLCTPTCVPLGKPSTTPARNAAPLGR